MKTQQRAYLFALVTVLFWSTVATAFKLTLQVIDLFQMLFYANLTAVVMLVIVLTVRKKVWQLKPVLLLNWRITVIAGLMNPALYYVVLFAAYDRLPAQVAQPINYTWAIVLTLLSIVFLRQKITVHDMLAALVCYGGVFVIATQGSLDHFAEADWTGIGLALLSTLIWAGYWILNIRDSRDPDIGLCLNFLIALPVTGLLCGVYSGFHIPSGGLLGAVYIGLFEMALSFLTWSLALKLSVNTSRVSNLIFLSPFLSLVLIHFILGESLYATTFLGLVMIVAGLLLQQRGQETA